MQYIVLFSIVSTAVTIENYIPTYTRFRIYRGGMWEVSTTLFGSLKSGNLKWWHASRYKSPNLTLPPNQNRRTKKGKKRHTSDQFHSQGHVLPRNFLLWYHLFIFIFCLSNHFKLWVPSPLPLKNILVTVSLWPIGRPSYSLTILEASTILVW